MALASPRTRFRIVNMSKILKLVRATLENLWADITILKTNLAHTAADAVFAIGCDKDQIIKSCILKGNVSGEAILFITTDGNRVDPVKAAQLGSETLGKANAALTREQRGFAIGDGSPIGYLHPIQAFPDPRRKKFEQI